MPAPPRPKGPLDLLATLLRLTGVMGAALLIGTFILLLIVVGTSIIGTALGHGVNPTLVLSIIGAPLWIIVVILCWKGAKGLHRRWNP